MEEYTEDKQFALDDKEKDAYQEEKVVDSMITYVMERYTSGASKYANTAKPEFKFEAPKSDELL